MERGQSAVSGRERVVAAYKGGYADCVPAYPIAGSFAGCLDGLSIEEYCTDPTKAVRRDAQLLRALPAGHHGGLQRPGQGSRGGRLSGQVLGLRRPVDRQARAPGRQGPSRAHGDPRSEEGRADSGVSRAVRGALGGSASERARRRAGRAVDDRDAPAQSRDHVPGHDRRSGVRPRPDALQHRVRQAGRRRRARHEDRPELLRPDRLVLPGRARRPTASSSSPTIKIW